MSLALELSDEFFDAVAARVAERMRVAPERRFLSKLALAEHYGVAPRTVKTWREKGCPAHKVGRDLMFSVEEVDQWLNRH